MKLGFLALILQILGENSRKLAFLSVYLSKIKLWPFSLFPPSKWLLRPLLYPRVSCFSVSGRRVIAAVSPIFAAASMLGLYTWSFGSRYLRCSEFGTRCSEFVFHCSEFNTRYSKYLLPCFTVCIHFEVFWHQFTRFLGLCFLQEKHNKRTSK